MKKFSLLVILLLSGIQLNVKGQIVQDTIKVLEIRTRGRGCIIPEQPHILTTDLIYRTYCFDNFLYSNKPNALILNTSLHSGSNYIPVQLMHQLYKGGSVDESLRMKSLNSGSNNHLRIGGIAQGQLSFIFNFFKNKRPLRYRLYKMSALSSQFTFENNTVLDASLQPDIASLYLLGNGFFADKTAQLGPSSLQYFQFNSIGFNQSFQVIKYGVDPELISIKALFSLNVGFNINQLNKYQRTDLYSGSLYTAPLGQYLDLNYNVSSQNFNENSKMGLGLNLGIGKSWNHFNASIGVHNLGFWKLNALQTLSADTSFQYQGIVLQTWGQNPSLPKDSLRNLLGLHSSTSSQKVWAPGKLKFQANFRSVWVFNITYWYTLKALPLVELRYAKWENRVLGKGASHLRFMFNPCIGYGGFGTYHLGFSSGLQYKRAALLLNISDLQSLALKNQNSFSAGIKLGYSF